MASKTDTTKTPPVIEIAEKVTSEVKVAATQVILGKKLEVSTVLRDRRDETLALVRRLLASAEINITFTLPEKVEGDANKLQVKLGDATTELSPEILESCLKGLEDDFKRGIVHIDENLDAETYGAALEADRSAGTTWKVAKNRLLANKSALLKRAATMQGKGELIGVFDNGELCIVDRADVNGNREPVITAFDAENNRITITTDTPNRASVMQSVDKNGGRFADYWEIRQAVGEDGFTVPQDSPERKKKGIVAAVEAVSGKPFVRSRNGKEWRSAILDCGDVSKITPVRAVSFSPGFKRAGVIRANPRLQDSTRGAVRVLRG